GGSVTDYFTLIKGQDSTPPALTSASAGSAVEVQVVFSETVDSATAQNIANYAIAGGISVSAASAAGNTVTLSTSTLSPGVTYTLTVNNVEDTQGNVIAPNSQITFSYQTVKTDSFQDGMNGYAGTEDTWIGSGVPDSNFGNDTALLADGADGSNGETASLVKWDPSNIPEGSTVSEAQIEFEVFGVSADAYDLYAGNIGWTEGSATWNSVDPYSNRGARVASFVPSTSGKHTITLNTAGLTMVQNWIDGPNNHGVFVMTGGTSDGLDMRSSEYATVDLRPRLLVTYTSAASGNLPPSAAFSYSASSLNVEFSDASNDSDGTIAGWSWDFGDGNGSSEQNPSHGFASEGAYPVTLTVTDDGGANDSVTQNVSVAAAPDTEAPSIPSGLTASGVTTDSLTLSWTASTDNVGVAGYIVRRDGVQVADLTTTSFTDTGLGSNTTYGYTVEAYDAAGNFSGQSTSVPMTTANNPPSASFMVATNQLTVTLTDSSTDSDGTIANWQWDFGDGAGSTLQNPVHTYAAGGTYTINLVVTDNDGGLDSTSRSIMISAGSGPVTVDLQQGLNGYSGAEDTYVASGSAAANQGAGPAILADGDDGPDDELISLLKWDVSSIPSGSTVTGASITLQVFNRSNDVYNLSAMLAAWSQSSATWNNTQPPANTGVQIGSFLPTSTGSYTIPLNANGLALVQSWVDGEPNNGITIRSGGTLNGVGMRSSEYGTQPRRPKLTITFQ
ncbi:MAG: DNRLRE domain-containing protein, partial [Gammaproteobacteria bacterium]